MKYFLIFITINGCIFYREKTPPLCKTNSDISALESRTALDSVIHFYTLKHGVAEISRYSIAEQIEKSQISQSLTVLSDSTKLSQLKKAALEVDMFNTFLMKENSGVCDSCYLNHQIKLSDLFVFYFKVKGIRRRMYLSCKKQWLIPETMFFNFNGNKYERLNCPDFNKILNQHFAYPIH